MNTPNNYRLAPRQTQGNSIVIQANYTRAIYFILKRLYHSLVTGSTLLLLLENHKIDSILLAQCIPEKQHLSNREFDFVMVCRCFVSIAVVHPLTASESPSKALLS